MSLTERLLSPIVQVRTEERPTALLMFAYSFLAMTAYNIVQPLVRSTFISTFGADNVPYVIFTAGLLIGLIMQIYGWLVARLPKRRALPISLAGMAGLLVAFWLLFQTGQSWVPVAFYFLGLILGTLLLSQFWTLANDIYDPRQAKRLFGFIGGGAALGGMAGAGLTVVIAGRGGTDSLPLWSAAALALSVAVVSAVIRTERPGGAPSEPSDKEEGGSGMAALRLLGQSAHLRLIAVLISLAAFGGVIIDQQLSMAAEAFMGRGETDAITSLLATVRFSLSAASFVIQVWVVRYIYRFLGIGVALILLPLGLGLTGVFVLLNATLFAPALASVVDRSLRYSVDRTTREIFFLPLPSSTKRQTKEFLDVTVDRFARGTAGLLLLLLIKPWGLALSWAQLSYVVLTLVAIWSALTVVVRRRYVATVRKGLEGQHVKPADVRLDVADLTTVETLLQELAHPDEHRVLYAIDVLDSLDKQNLVTPLLLHHESPAVRTRALTVLRAAPKAVAQRSLPMIQRMIGDDSPEVRTAAIATLASIRGEDAAELARPLLMDRSPKIVATAAVALVASDRPEDVAAGEATLSALATDTRESSSPARRYLAGALRHVESRRCRRVLIPLLHDPSLEVAEEAMRSVRDLHPLDILFVPTLISLLGHRRLKGGARDTLVGYGETVLTMLGHFLRDPREDLWVRRHIPATIARIPCQQAMDILIDALEERDGFLRYKVMSGLEKMRRDHPALTLQRGPIETLALKEGFTYFRCLMRHHDLFVRAAASTEALLARALEEKIGRSVDRIYRLLALLYPWRDVADARWAAEHGDARARARAFEYLDNILAGNLRKRLMPALEDLPVQEKVQRGHVILKTRARDVEETLLDLINDEDEVIAAAATDLVRERQEWSLVGDVEHVLAHRNVKDQYLFEAASWTLAAYRLPEDRRRALWLEPLPAVVLANRLRDLPMFALVGVDELLRIARTGRQARYDAGETLFRVGVVPDTVHVLLDGKLAAAGRRTGTSQIAPPATLGFEEVLEGRPLAATIRTVETTVTLSLTSDEFRTMLADNGDLVQGFFRTLAERSTARVPPIVRGTPDDEISHPAAGQLTPIQKVLALQRIPVFSKISGEEMLHLASIARQVPLETGQTLSDETDPPVLCMVLSGELALYASRGDQQPLIARRGDVLGIYETLAGTQGGAVGRDPLRLVVGREGSALKIEGEDLFDLLGQRPDLLQQLFSALFQGRATGV